MATDPTKARVQTQLHAISQLLRTTDRLGPQAQALLAELMDELSNALDSSDVPDEKVATLTENTAELVHAVHQEQPPGMLAAFEERLEDAAVAVETKAPTLANLPRRLAEMLSNLGI